MAIPTADTSAQPPAVAGRGTRSRAGNAMGRTRGAALSGAVAAVAKYGSRKATMGDIAMLAGIAKATLYNHFRTRDDVYRAVVAVEVETIASAARARVGDGFDAAVAEAARRLGEHPAARRVAADEPAVLAALVTPNDGEGWTAARAHIAGALTDVGCVPEPAAVDVVLRYLVSQLLAASGPADRASQSALIAAAVAQPATDRDHPST